jgi:uncharacterized protein YjbI with pentapeptide repeats
MDPEVERRLNLLESQLLAQEHRLVHVVGNFFSLLFFKYSPQCRWAIVRAFVWTLVGFVVPTSRGSSSITLALAAIVIAIWANLLMQQQNQIMRDQTVIMQQQSDIAEATSFNSRLDDLQKELAASVTGSVLPESLHREVVDWSQSLVPYGRPDASGRLLSRERGRLLRSLVNAPADTRRAIAESDFSGANLRQARFQAVRPVLAEAHLENAVLDGAALSSADLHEAYLHKASLRQAFLDSSNLADANVTNADLSGADLRGADLRHGSFAGTDLRNAQLEGAQVERPDWLAYVTSLKPPAKLNRGQWRVETNAGDGSFRLRRVSP